MIAAKMRMNIAAETGRKGPCLLGGTAGSSSPSLSSDSIDSNGAVFEVDVIAAQCEQFTNAEAGRSGEQE
jgi:hypothetical protein